MYLFLMMLINLLFAVIGFMAFGTQIGGNFESLYKAFMYKIDCSLGSYDLA